MVASFGVGLTLPQLGPHVTRAAVRGFCEQAEAIGFGSLWVQEHLFFALEPSAPYAARPGMPVPEAYRTTFSPLELLASAAAWTDRVLLGTGILVGGYHRPVELAQRLATLDHLSDGRLIAGLSVGWSKDEHEQMDVAFHTRGRRLSELVEALLVCWGPDPVRFDGEFFQIPASLVSPKPLQAPHPPLLSGMRSPAGLQRTAMLFDIWNPASGSLEQLQAGVTTINAARPAGRPPVEVMQRIFTEPPFVVPGLEPLSLSEMVDAVAAARAAGFSQVIVDSGFTTEVTSPHDWIAFPERLAPLLEAAS
ncbi:MAG TPA: TIGR03619 family F420-dependent LLM class oxidoreductase [Acidimicrobiales bacterium]|nr:TIGR03619 family F420-dependent LLM class oxidoreductase [Acidimicrobiales bacterium]